MNTYLAFASSFGLVGWCLGMLLLFTMAWENHTHEPTGIQVGTTICLEYGTLHYPDPMAGFDSHIDAAFCGEVVEADEEERFPPLNSTTHLAQ